MDQVKEILKQAVKHRFWIAVGLSAILPMVAYLVGAGEIQAKAAAGKAAIEGADNGVKAYAAGRPVNAQYKQIVAEKTEVLSKDVGESWQKLYDRQAPLLKWPERVHAIFTGWGRQWPKDTDASAVQVAIIDYVNAYQAFVTDVYKSFKPFDPTDGTGIVAAPPEEALLRPAKFSETEPPDLGKVWAAQEKLWIQRTLLDVVNTVNKDATSWDTAIIKQINVLEVGNAAAQDQRSLAKAEALEPAPEISDPSKPPAPPPAAPAPGAPAGAVPGVSEADLAGMVMFIKSDSPAFKILPVELSVMIDQDHIQDLLVALENSPMTIQVKDFEMSKPTTRITKPEKGAQQGFALGGYYASNSPPPMAYPQPMTGYGGRASNSSAYPYPYPNGQGPNPTAVAPPKKGVDVRSKDLQKQRAAAIESAKKNKSTSLHDPFYNIVEVKVFGQARFFNPPPPPPATAPSQSAAAPAAAEKKDQPAEKKAETPKPAEAASNGDAPRADADTKPETKADADTKPETKADADTKPESPKSEAPDPKAEAPKAESGKTPESRPEGASKKDEAPKTKSDDAPRGV